MFKGGARSRVRICSNAPGCCMPRTSTCLGQGVGDFHDVSTEQHMLHVAVLRLVIPGAVGRCSSFQALSGSNLNCLFVVCGMAGT